MKHLFSALLLTVLLMVSTYSAGYGQTIYIQGEQSGILQADSVYITGNITVPDDQSLTFVPGSVVISTGYFGIDVRGAMLAEGTESAKITFTVTDTTGFSNLYDTRGGWNGIRFSQTGSDSDSSLFSHCIFEYGKALGDSLERYGGVFNIRNFSAIRISECSFSHNKAMFWGGAVFAENSDLLISDCEFTDNFCGTPGPPYGYGGAVCLRYSGATLEGCRFTGNRSTGIGGAVSCEYSDVLVISGTFSDNFSGLGGAFGYLRSVPAKPVSNNLFTGNSSLFFGGGIACIKANPLMVNNTITGNYSTSYGGGFYCNDSAAPVMVNTILYGNNAPEGHQVYIWDVNSAPSFYYCNVQGGYAAFGGTGGIGFHSPYEHNLDTLPFFSGMAPHPFSLADNSPCLNAGNPDTTGLMLPPADLAGNPRIYADAVDIGCYENQTGPAAVAINSYQNRILCFPNPFRDQITFMLPPFTGEAAMVMIGGDGRQVLRLSGITDLRFTLNLSAPGIANLETGMYHVTFTSAHYTLGTSILLIK